MTKFGRPDSLQSIMNNLQGRIASLERITTFGTVTGGGGGGGFIDFGIVDALPTSANINDKCTFRVGDSILWQLIYDGDGTYPWKLIGGPTLYADIPTSETRSSTSYGALTTAGPTVTAPLPGDYYIQCGTQMTAAGSFGGYMSYSVGASTAVDSDGCKAAFNAAGTGSPVSPVHLKTDVGGSDDIVSKYRAVTNTPTFLSRWIMAIPTRVTQ